MKCRLSVRQIALAVRNLAINRSNRGVEISIAQNYQLAAGLVSHLTRMTIRS